MESAKDNTFGIIAMVSIIAIVGIVAAVTFIGRQSAMPTSKGMPVLLHKQVVSADGKVKNTVGMEWYDDWDMMASDDSGYDGGGGVDKCDKCLNECAVTGNDNCPKVCCGTGGNCPKC